MRYFLLKVIKKDLFSQLFRYKKNLVYVQRRILDILSFLYVHYYVTFIIKSILDTFHECLKTFKLHTLSDFLQTFFFCNMSKSKFATNQEFQECTNSESCNMIDWKSRLVLAKLWKWIYCKCFQYYISAYLLNLLQMCVKISISKSWKPTLMI